MSIGGLPGRARVLFPGELACGVVAAAIAGVGMKTHLRELSTVGIKPAVFKVAKRRSSP